MSPEATASLRLGRPPTGRTVQIARPRLSPRGAEILRALQEQHGSISAGLEHVLVKYADAQHAADEAASENEELRAQNRAKDDYIVELLREQRRLRAQLEKAGVRKRLRSRARREVAAPTVVQDLWTWEQVMEAQRTPCRMGCGSMVDPHAVASSDLRCPECRQKGVTPLQGQGVTLCQGLSPKGVTPYPVPDVPPEEPTHDQPRT